jgi:hypothetical protein
VTKWRRDGGCVRVRVCARARACGGAALIFHAAKVMYENPWGGGGGGAAGSPRQ